MGNCLIRKSKGSIENSSAPYFGGIIFKFGSVSNSQGAKIWQNKLSPGRVKVVAISGKFSIKDGESQLTEFTFPDGAGSNISRTIIPYNDNAIISVIGKYGEIMAIEQAASPSGVEGTTDISLSDLNYSSLTNVSFDKGKSSGSLDFGTLTANIQRIALSLRQNALPQINIPETYFFSSSLTAFLLYSCNNNVTCNIMSFKDCKNLIELHLRYNSGVTGELTDLFDALASTEKTSTLTVVIHGTNCTYNGVLLTNEEAEANGKAFTVTFSGGTWNATRS